MWTGQVPVSDYTAGADSVPPFTALAGLHLVAERAELIERARQLVPTLRGRRAETTRLRRLPDDTVRDMNDAGFGVLTRPRAYGGHEVDSQTLGAVVAELARGCGSTAWVCAIINTVSFIAAAALPEEGWREIFESGEHACSPFNMRSGGMAKRVDGGYLVEVGEWPWASGSQIAGWALPRVMLVDDDGQVRGAMIVAVPRSDFEILDEWHTTGMRGTASNVVKLTNAFIPEHRAGQFAPLLRGEHLAEVPGQYRQAFIANVFLGLGWVGVGLARAAEELVLERARGKPVAFTSYLDLSQTSRLHVTLGEAHQKTDAAMMLLNRAAALLDSWASRGEQPGLRIRLQVRADLGFAVRLCHEAVQACWQEAGASSIAEDSAISRVALDIEPVILHAANSPTTAVELFGAVLAGAEPKVMMVGPGLAMA